MEGFRARTASSSQSSRRSSPTERLPPKDATKAKREYSGYGHGARAPIGARLGRPRKRVRVSACRLLQVTCSPSDLARARAIRARDVDEHGLLRARASALLSAACVCCVFACARRRHLRPRRVPSSLPGTARPRVARALLEPRAPRAGRSHRPARRRRRAPTSRRRGQLGITPPSPRAAEPELVPHNLTFSARPPKAEQLDGWMDAKATWYGGPSGPGPDSMSIYGIVRIRQALGNHFISAWYDDHFPRAPPRERPTAAQLADRRKPTTRTDAGAPPPSSSRPLPSSTRPSPTAGTPTAGTTGA